MYKSIRVNEAIRSEKIRVVGKDGEQLGVLSREEALSRASEQSLDLVEVAPTAQPPVCRIIDYSKYKYEQEKSQKEARKRQKVVHMKEVKLHPKTEEHDYQVKLNQALKFLKRGDRVKITMVFKGREMAHPEIGQEILYRFAKDISSVGQIEKEPRREGRTLYMLVSCKIT